MKKDVFNINRAPARPRMDQNPEATWRGISDIEFLRANQWDGGKTKFSGSGGGED